MITDQISTLASYPLDKTVSGAIQLAVPLTDGSESLLYTLSSAEKLNQHFVSEYYHVF